MRTLRSAFVLVTACGLGGVDVRETDLSREKQLRTLQTYSPVPVPSSASDVHLHLTSFQDSSFQGSFVLPAADFEAYSRALVPNPDRTGFVGRPVGSYTSSVRVDGAARRVMLAYWSR